MKRIRFASCLMVLFLLVLNLEIALGQEQSGIDAIPQDFADHSIGAENADGGYVVNLEVDGGFLALTIPADYQYQPVELTEIERYPFTYILLLMRKQKLRFWCKALYILKKIKTIF